MRAGIFTEQQEANRLDYLSNSKMGVLLDSRQKFYHKYVLGKETKSSEQMELGKLIHMGVLQGARFRELFLVMPDFGDMRSPSNRAKRDAWKQEIGPDRVVCDQEQFEKVVYSVDAILQHNVARDLFTGGLSERKLYWQDEESGVWLMGNPDFIIDKDLGQIPRGTVAELKTTSKSVERTSFIKQVQDNEYYRQISLYLHLTGKLLGIPDNKSAAWVTVETNEPYPVAVYTPSENMIKAGNVKFRKAITIFKEMKDADPEFKNKKLWTGYQDSDTAEEIDLDYWFYRKDLDFQDITQIQAP